MKDHRPKFRSWNKNGIIERKSYVQRFYESVDDMSLSWVIYSKMDGKQNLLSKSLLSAPVN